MKKMFVFFLLISLFISLKTQAEFSQDCAESYENRTTLQLMVYGCLYDVEVCYTCDLIVQNSDVNIALRQFAKVDPECDSGDDITFVMIRDEIYKQIINVDLIEAELCTGMSYIPCDEVNPDNFDIMVPFYGCWSKHRDFGSERIWYFPCLAAFNECRLFIKFCWDSKIDGVISDVVAQEHYPEDCPGLASEPPDPLEGEESECWSAPTPCDK